MKFPNKIFFKYLSDIIHFTIGKKINKIIDDFNPDLIIGTWLNPFGAYAKYVDDKNITYFALAEGDDGLIHPFKYRGWRRIESRINRNCRAVIAVSERMKQKMLEKTGLKNIKLIRNGYDEGIFNFKPGKCKENNYVIKIITVANFYYVKGHDLLLDALKHLNKDVKLTLIGSGPLMENCAEKVKAENLSDKVEFLGSVPHDKISGLLRQHDLFCLPSRSEGMPGAPLEAMACGLPVVAFDVGGLNEIIINGYNGYLCKPESATDLAEKILLTAEKEWDSYKISEWVSTNYSWKNWATTVLEEYNNLTNKE